MGTKRSGLRCGDSSNRGDATEAVELQREALGLVYTAHRSRSVEGLEATRHFADWLAAHGHHREAGDQYAFASNLVRIVAPQDVAERVAVLRLAADNHLLAELGAPNRRIPAGPGELITAVNVIQPNANVRAPGAVARAGIAAAEYGCVDLDGMTPNLVDQHLFVAEMLRDIGDWCVALDVPQQFGNAHIAAWDLLAAVYDGERIRAAWFAEPTPLHVPAPRSRVLSDAGDAPVGRIELRFSVDEKGTAHRVEVVTSEPPGLIDGDSVRRIENSRFRPRIEDGRLVTATTSMSFEFRYDPAAVR